LSSFRARGALAALPLAALTVACSPVVVVNALVPRGGYTVARDIAYGDGAARRLDVYRPAASAPLPVVVFFYGGSWQTGSKDEYLFIGQALASRGFVSVIPNYRLYPETRYPGFLEDSAAAVRWTRDHASEYGGDPHRLFLMGHSAGAYNVAMLALDGAWLEQVGMDPKRDLSGVVGLAGPYDFLPLTDPVLKLIFGPPDGLAATQPINYVSAGAPPMFLAAGDADTTVDPGNVTRLAARLRADGDPVETKFYPGINHTRLAGALAWPLRFLAPVLTDVVGFMRRHDQPSDTTTSAGTG
jgi:acetyl esterase/lipase